MRRIVIDCDPGIDDAQAIMMAYAHPEVQIEAITTVAGNVGIESTSQNALKILDVLEAGPIPVFVGANTALLGRGDQASYVHGIDGLGGVLQPQSARRFEAEPAATGLVRLAKENEGELELIAIGPLTNIALAIRLDPKLPARYKRLVVMGGAHYAQGNTDSLPAEFNIFADPEAASIVFENWPEFTMISWEATMNQGASLAEFECLYNQPTPRSRFLKTISAQMVRFLIEELGRDKIYAADPLAMAVLIEPEIVVASERRYVQVETNGKLTRGMTVVDWWYMTGRPANADIVLNVDHQRFLELMKNAG